MQEADKCTNWKFGHLNLIKKNTRYFLVLLKPLLKSRQTLWLGPVPALCRPFGSLWQKIGETGFFFSSSFSCGERGTTWNGGGEGGREALKSFIPFTPRLLFPPRSGLKGPPFPAKKQERDPFTDLRLLLQSSDITLTAFVTWRENFKRQNNSSWCMNFAAKVFVNAPILIFFLWMHPFWRKVLSRCTHFEEKFSLDAPILSLHGRSENSPP